MTSMMPSVSRLDTASYSVRLWFGCVDDGTMNGNSAKPAVRMTPVTAAPLATNAVLLQPMRAQNAASTAPANTAIGASHVDGCAVKFASQPPGVFETVFASGVNDVFASGIDTIR